MRVMVDENIPLMTVDELIKLGHNVLDVRGTKFGGMPDEKLWALALKENRLLITTDKGFAQNRYGKHYGILIVRLKQPNRLKIHQKIIKGITLFKEKEWPSRTVVMRDSFHSTWKRKIKK